MNRVGALKGPNDVKFILNDQGSRSGHKQGTGFKQFFGKHGILAIYPILMGRWPTLTRTFFNID